MSLQAVNARPRRQMRRNFPAAITRYRSLEKANDRHNARNGESGLFGAYDHPFDEIHTSCKSSLFLYRHFTVVLSLLISLYKRYQTLSINSVIVGRAQYIC
jgi:hypothetical protein